MRNLFAVAVTAGLLTAFAPAAHAAPASAPQPLAGINAEQALPNESYAQFRRGYVGRGYGGRAFVGRPYAYGRPYRGGRYYGRRDFGGSVGAGIAGLAAGAIIGGAIANQQAQAGVPVVDPNLAAYCEQRYRSYDPASGTFLSYDGNRYVCTYP